MCDFRKIIGVRFSDGTEVSCDKKLGHYPWFDDLYLDDPPEAGLYHIGATGCGVYYWNTKEILSDYKDDQFNKCKFITDGYVDWINNG